MNKVLIAEKRVEITKLGREHVMPRLEVWIDRKNDRIGNCNPDLQPEPHDWSKLSDKWMEQYVTCRKCGKPVDDSHLARAYWRHEAPICSATCLDAERLARYACCELARPLSRSCVCVYATECPVHGEIHHGSHD